MGEVKVIDPATLFRFEVIVGENILSAGFTKVSGLQESQEPIQYREGTDDTYFRKFPGLREYEDITMSRGVGDRAGFIDWRNDVINCRAGYKKGVTIKIKNCNGTTARIVKVSAAWPTSIQLADLDAASNEVSIETLVLAHEGQPKISIVQYGEGNLPTPTTTTTQ